MVEKRIKIIVFVFKILLPFFVVAQNGLGEIESSKRYVIGSGVHNDRVISIVNKKDITVSALDGAILKGKVRIDIINSENIVIEDLTIEDGKNRNATIFVKNSKNVLIKNNTIIRGGIANTSSAIRLESNLDGINISNNSFIDLRSIGIHIVTRENEDNAEKKDIIISNNIFRDTKSVKAVYPKSNGNGMESILVGWGFAKTKDIMRGVKIKGNIFENNIGDGLEVISLKTSGNFVENNTFINNVGALSLRMGDKNVIRNNVFIKGERAIRVFGANHEIIGNEFRNCKIGIEMRNGMYEAHSKTGGIGYYQIQGVVIRDNSFAGTTQPILTIDSKKGFPPRDLIIKSNKIK